MSEERVTINFFEDGRGFILDSNGSEEPGAGAMIARQPVTRKVRVEIFLKGFSE
jgi:hypothetical protein